MAKEKEETVSQTIDEKIEVEQIVIKDLTLMDDVFMTYVFKDKESCEIMLQIILDNPTIRVISCQVQISLPNLYGRSVRLDIIAEDANGIIYNIEVQNATNGAPPERLRLNTSLIDSNFTNAGDSYTKIREVYVIFITEKDYFGKGQPIYHIDQVIRETGDLYDDKSHKIYVTGSFQQETTELGKLMHDFHCVNGEDMLIEPLAKRVSMLKGNDKEVERMNQSFSQLTGKLQAKLFEQSQQLAEKDKQLETKDQKIDEQQETINKKDQELAEKEARIAFLEKQNAALQA